MRYSNIETATAPSKMLKPIRFVFCLLRNKSNIT
jgi:hypothetical protein